MPGDDNSVSPIGERACQHVRTLVQCMSGANEGRLEPFRRRPSPFCKAEHANADAASARPDVTATGESVGWLLAPSHGFGSPRRKRRCLPCGATALSSSQRYGPTVGDHAKVTRQVAALRGHHPGVSCFPTGEKRFFDLAVSERTHPFVRTGTSRQSVRHPCRVWRRGVTAECGYVPTQPGPTPIGRASGRQRSVLQPLVQDIHRDTDDQSAAHKTLLRQHRARPSGPSVRGHRRRVARVPTIFIQHARMRRPRLLFAERPVDCQARFRSADRGLGSGMRAEESPS